MKEFLFPLIGLPMDNIGILINICACLIMSVVRIPRGLTGASLVALIIALTMKSGLPNLSADGIFSFQDFFRTFLEFQLGEVLFHFIIIIFGVGFGRNIVRSLAPRRFFSKN